MENKNEIVTLENIRSRVYIIRGLQVMLDSDLAEIYGYELKAMNQQVKRNAERFPGDFMFQLSREEVELVKSQIVTSPIETLFAGQDGGHGKRGFLTTAVVDDFINQYPTLKIKPNPDCHDRWIVIDYGLPTEQVYHCGASSKDAGKKLCAINKVDPITVIHPVISSLLLLPDKTI